VYGGAFTVKGDDPISKTTTRLLSPEAQNCRVLLMDNVKTFRLSSADLESLVTDPHVNGHRMYKGQGGVPNYFTLFITLNGASMSKDFAQRTVPVRFQRAVYGDSWEADLDAFIAANRTALIADLIGVMRSQPAKMLKATRWARWESEVLARVDDPNGCQRLVLERTGEMDADREQLERICEAFVDLMRRKFSHEANGRRYHIRSAALTRIVELGTNRHVDSNDASGIMVSITDGRFRRKKINGQRIWEWIGPDAPPKYGREAAPAKLEFHKSDTREDIWALNGQPANATSDEGDGIPP
jgi:hypothetical protein